jgi:hypothetical protein
MPRQPLLALQEPEQAPCWPLPRQLPLPLLRESRPVPRAVPGPLDTITFTAPLFDTRPETLAPPLPVTIPLEMNTLVRNDWSQLPLRVMIRTPQEPSYGPACAVEAKETVQAAKAVARVTARIELLSMGDPRVGLVRLRPIDGAWVVGVPFSSSWAGRSWIRQQPSADG